MKVLLRMLKDVLGWLAATSFIVLLIYAFICLMYLAEELLGSSKLHTDIYWLHIMNLTTAYTAIAFGLAMWIVDAKERT